MEIPIGKSSFDNFDETKSVGDKYEINDWTSDKHLVRTHGIIPIITSDAKVVAPNLIESERSSPSTENA